MHNSVGLPLLSSLVKFQVYAKNNFIMASQVVTRLPHTKLICGLNDNFLKISLSFSLSLTVNVHSCRFGKMVACFRYASIDVHSVYLPPAKLDFNYEKQEWIQKETDEVQLPYIWIFHDCIPLLLYVADLFIW